MFDLLENAVTSIEVIRQKPTPKKVIKIKAKLCLHSKSLRLSLSSTSPISLIEVFVHLSVFFHLRFLPFTHFAI